MPSVKVLNQSDARPWHFQELLRSNGRWRIVIFAGDITQPEQRDRINRAGEAMDKPTSFLHRFTPVGAKYDTVFEVLCVHSTPRTEVSVFDFPEVFRPYDEVDGWDYWKIFADDKSYHEGHGQIYSSFGIASRGCAVILRPDQYASYVGPMDDVESLDKFFSGFMISQEEGASTKSRGNQSSVAAPTNGQSHGTEADTGVGTDADGVLSDLGGPQRGAADVGTI